MSKSLVLSGEERVELLKLVRLALAPLISPTGLLKPEPPKREGRCEPNGEPEKLRRALPPSMGDPRPLSGLSEGKARMLLAPL